MLSLCLTFQGAGTTGMRKI